MASFACLGLLGAIHSHWLERSHWLTALLFTHTISIALWAVPKLLHSQEGFTAVGSRLIWLGHSRATLAAAAGKVG
jgi:hypothetical protein